MIPATRPAPARALAALGLAAGLTGCPSPDANPPVLWLALDGAETRVRLVADEPPPY